MGERMLGEPSSWKIVTVYLLCSARTRTHLLMMIMKIIIGECYTLCYRMCNLHVTVGIIIILLWIGFATLSHPWRVTIQVGTRGPEIQPRRRVFLWYMCHSGHQRRRVGTRRPGARVTFTREIPIELLIESFSFPYAINTR